MSLVLPQGPTATDYWYTQMILTKETLIRMPYTSHYTALNRVRATLTLTTTWTVRTWLCLPQISEEPIARAVQIPARVILMWTAMWTGLI